MNEGKLKEVSPNLRSFGTKTANSFRCDQGTRKTQKNYGDYGAMKLCEI